MFIIASQLYSCKSESISSSGEGIFIIEGKINSDLSLSGTDLKMEIKYQLDCNNNYFNYVFDSTIIRSDGEFQLNIFPPPSNLHYKINYSNSSISDTSARIFVGGLFNVYKNGKPYGFITCREKLPDSLGNDIGNYGVGYIYSTKNVLIIAYDTIYGVPSTLLYNRNMSLHSGWNQVVYYSTQSNSLFRNINVVVDNSFKGNWFFQKN